jgi:hypothetical protein
MPLLAIHAGLAHHHINHYNTNPCRYGTLRNRHTQAKGAGPRRQQEQEGEEKTPLSPA